MATWSSRAGELFIKLLVIEVEKENLNCTNIKGKTWNKLVIVMTEKMGCTYTVPNLKGKNQPCDDLGRCLGAIYCAIGILACASTQVPPIVMRRELAEEFINGQKRSSASLDNDLEGPFHPPHKKNASSLRQKKESKSSKMDNAIDAWAAFSMARMEKYKLSGHNDTVNDAYNNDTYMNVLEGMEDVGSQ
ncbi:unnamed protein product [Ilex paraguariensis]|uniref:Uncharacterized protein n=1 Tax=Ilex paraguariensis TaxID=185542 RepID=A0ABC8QVZ8_9AQUA